MPLLWSLNVTKTSAQSIGNMSEIFPIAHYTFEHAKCFRLWTHSRHKNYTHVKQQ